MVVKPMPWWWHWADQAWSSWGFHTSDCTVTCTTRRWEVYQRRYWEWDSEAEAWCLKIAWFYDDITDDDDDEDEDSGSS